MAELDDGSTTSLYDSESHHEDLAHPWMNDNDVEDPVYCAPLSERCVMSYYTFIMILLYLRSDCGCYKPRSRDITRFSFSRVLELVEVGAKLAEAN